MSDRLITIAVHTYDHAVALRNLLEREGITVSLQNLHLESPIVASGLRVRINEDDLPLALRIIENTDIFNATDDATAKAVSDHHYLVPVDFSPHSLKACDLAFLLASRHGATLKIIHAITDPTVTDNSPLVDTLDYAVPDHELRGRMFKQANSRIKQLTDSLRQRIKSGELPPVKFSTYVGEGIPEDVITQYSRDNHPKVIIMGTRTRLTRERDLIGSVTAEVLDSCRTPVITLPECTTTKQITDLAHALIFCDLGQTDMLVVDALYRAFHDQAITVDLVAIADRLRRRRRAGNDPAEKLLAYCREHYPRFNFTFRTFDQSTVADGVKAIDEQQHIDLIVVANHRRSPISRIFNPSIAHRLLFNADIPILAIPVGQH